MKRRRFPAAAAGQRRNADLFFADLMGGSVAPAGPSPARLEADRFMADLLGEPAHRFPAGQMLIAASEEAWGEGGGSCPDRDEVEQTWLTLSQLWILLKADRKEMESNPLVLEVQMLKQLSDVLDIAGEVPAEVWGEIWKELKAFASCDVKPLVARVKKGEKHANAVLRVLNGFTSILQGYVHDRIDARFKNRLEGLSGWSKAVATLLVHVIKRQVPVIQRELDAGRYDAVATAFADLKKQLEGQGLSVTKVWDVIVALGKEIIGKAIDDALENGARFAAKKAGKKLMGSAAKAASVIFILEDIVLFVHALATISTYKERLREFNRVVLGFLARMRDCKPLRPGQTYPAYVRWKRRTFARLDCQIFLYSFAPVKGGSPGEGEWHAAPLTTVLDGATTPIARIDVPPDERSGERILPFRMPPVAQWPAQGDSYVAVQVTEVDDAGQTIRQRPLFVAACMP